MTLHIENPKDATRKVLELINESGKVAGYKINAQKSLAFLYTNNERSEREIKETIPYSSGAEHRECGPSVGQDWKNFIPIGGNVSSS